MFYIYVAAIWIVYLLIFLGIRFGTSSNKESFFATTTARFKIFSAIIVLFHFIVYTFYIGGLGRFDKIAIKKFIFHPAILFLSPVLGWLAVVCGLVLFAAAYYQFRKFDLAASEIFYRGVFKKIRWPIHTSLILLWFGIALIYNNALGLSLGIILLAPMIYLQTKLEERHLVEVAREKGLEEQYKEYRSKTNLLLPFKIQPLFKFKKND